MELEVLQCDLRSGWKWMASFTSLSLYSLTKKYAIEIRSLNYPTQSLDNLASSSSIKLRKCNWRSCARKAW